MKPDSKPPLFSVFEHIYTAHGAPQQESLAAAEQGKRVLL
jgi:hypothetical protein